MQTKVPNQAASKTPGLLVYTDNVKRRSMCESRKASHYSSDGKKDIHSVLIPPMPVLLSRMTSRYLLCASFLVWHMFFRKVHDRSHGHVCSF